MTDPRKTWTRWSRDAERVLGPAAQPRQDGALSHGRLARALGFADRRHVRRMARGLRPVPPAVAERTARIDAYLDAMAGAAETFAADPPGGARAARIVLVAYGSDGDLARYRPRDAAVLTHEIHAAGLARAADRLEARGVEVTFRVLDAAAYERWRERAGLRDDESVRARWAVIVGDASEPGVI